MNCGNSLVPINTLEDYKEIVYPGRQNLPASFNVFKALRPCHATGLHPHHHHGHHNNGHHAVPTHFTPLNPIPTHLAPFNPLGPRS